MQNFKEYLLTAQNTPPTAALTPAAPMTMQPVDITTITSAVLVAMLAKPSHIANGYIHEEQR